MTRHFRLDFIIYAIGLASLFAVDVLVSQFFDSKGIAEWALVRSLVGIAAVLPLLGLDQVIVRHPSHSRDILRVLLLQVPLLSIPVGIALESFDLLDNWWLGSLLASGSAASLALFQYCRSHRMFLMSQIAQQGWKIAILLTLFVMILSDSHGALTTYTIGVIILVDIMVAATVLLHSSFRVSVRDDGITKADYAIGIRFMISALLLTTSIYVEQLVVNRFGSHSEAALYFTSTTYFVFMFSLVNGYLAFLLGPWIRDHHDQFMHLVENQRGLIALAAALYSGGLNFLGYMLWEFARPSVGTVDHVLQLLFLCVGFIRTLYLIPSAYLGVFGTTHQHDRLILFQIFMAFVAIGVFLLLQSAGVTFIHSVATASTINWLLRTAVGFYFTLQVANDRARLIP